MLIVNNKILNLTDPKTEQEKRVARELAQLVADYKLEEGKIVSIVYPKEYIKANKDNPSRPYRPASFKISYRDVLRTATGSEDWRFAERVDPGKNDIGQNYSPNGNVFTGSWQLGLGQADLLYFLLNISSRMEGGKNTASKKRPYMVVENKVVDAQNFAEKELESAYLRITLFKDLTEEKLRAFAKHIGLNSFETEETDILKKTLYTIVSADKNGYKKLSSFVGGKKAAQNDEDIKEFSELAVAAISKGVIELQKTQYVYMSGALAGQPLFNTGNKTQKEKALALFLSNSPEETETLKALCAE